jgi:hypothetical protein
MNKRKKTDVNKMRTEPMATKANNKKVIHDNNKHKTIVLSIQMQKSAAGTIFFTSASLSTTRFLTFIGTVVLTVKRFSDRLSG